jgi:hypothetical protein
LPSPRTNQADGVVLISLACRSPEPRLPQMQPVIGAAVKVLARVAGAALAMLVLLARHTRNLGGAPAGAAVGAEPGRRGRRGIWIQSHVCLILHRAVVRNHRLATKTMGPSDGAMGRGGTSTRDEARAGRRRTVLGRRASLGTSLTGGAAKTWKPPDRDAGLQLGPPPP